MDPAELTPLADGGLAHDTDPSGLAPHGAVGRRAPLPRWAIAVLIMSGLAFFVGVGAALIVRQMDDEATGDTMVLTPLPEPASSEPRVAAPVDPVDPVTREVDDPAEDVEPPTGEALETTEEAVAARRADDRERAREGDRAPPVRRASTMRPTVTEERGAGRETRAAARRDTPMAPTTMRITTEFF